MRALILSAALLAATAMPALAQRDYSDVTLKAEQLSDRIHVLYGAGGNIGIFLGDDATIMIDDQFAPLAPRIEAKIKTLKDQDIAMVLNTHYHGDHTGSNAYFGRAGAMIIAHDNVRARMAANRKDTGAPDAIDPALPAMTYSYTSTLYNSGEKIDLIHVEEAHTDGDTLVYFRGANVIHMGDTFFEDRFPFIDTGAGGALSTMIDAHDMALAMIDDDTVIIPGHGNVTNKAGLKRARNVLADIQGKARAARGAGKDEAGFIASGPAAAYPDLVKARGPAWVERFLKAAFATAD